MCFCGVQSLKVTHFTHFLRQYLLDRSRFDWMQLASALGRRMREGLQRIAHETGLCWDHALATKSPTPILGTGIGGSPK